MQDHKEENRRKDAEEAWLVYRAISPPEPRSPSTENRQTTTQRECRASNSQNNPGYTFRRNVFQTSDMDFLSHQRFQRNRLEPVTHLVFSATHPSSARTDHTILSETMTDTLFLFCSSAPRARPNSIESLVLVGVRACRVVLVIEESKPRVPRSHERA